MDDLDVSFDFESNLNAAEPVAALPGVGPARGMGPGGGGGPGMAVATQDDGRPGAGKPRFQQYVSKKNFRQTVCRHWLRGLCMKGEQCGFLHQFDRSRMPICRFFAKYGVCRESECVFKHSSEEVKECNMYNLGFCIHGPLCRYKHIQRRGPPPPPEQVEQAKPKEFRNVNLDSRAHIRPPQRYQPPQPQLEAPPQQQQYLLTGQSTPAFQGGQQQQQQQQQDTRGMQNMQNMQMGTGYPPQAMEQQPRPPPPPQPSDPYPADEMKCLAVPSPDEIARTKQVEAEEKQDFLETERSRFFVLHVRNTKDLVQAFSSCQWPTNLSYRMKLNEAYSTVQNVLLLFIDVSKQELCGCARMEGTIGKGRATLVRRPGAGSGNTIPLKWLSQSRVPPSVAQQLVNDNKPLTQTRDGQEVSTDTGKQAVRSFPSSSLPEGTPSNGMGLGRDQPNDRKRPRSDLATGTQDFRKEEPFSQHRRVQPLGGSELGGRNGATVASTSEPQATQQAQDFLETERSRFFVLHVRNTKDLVQAFSSCQWPTNLSYRMKLNEAYSTVQNVLLLFIDVSKQELCGCARMEGTIGKGRATLVRRPGAGSGNTIPLKWLSQSRVPPSVAQQLVNDNKPLTQTRDGQEVSTDTGKQAVRSFPSSSLPESKRPRY